MIIPSVEIKKILYATDLSENSRYAFAYAASLADRYGAQLVLLHVLPELPKVDARVIGYIEEAMWEEIKMKNILYAKMTLTGKKRGNVAIREALERFCEDTKDKYEGDSLVADEIIIKRGNPVEQIVKVAEEQNCDLIVMGRYGHGTLKDAMIGSTARRVLRRTQKALFVVRLPEDNN
ncbi:MAG: universal stress protein [Desulfobacteraceae bacterium]|nr:universal stress protein [Desulfobacteraceae bacterium]